MALYSRASSSWTHKPWQCHAELSPTPSGSDSSRKSSTSLENLDKVIAPQSPTIKSKLLEAYRSENKGGDFVVPLVFTRTRKPNISVQRNIRRQEYLDKVAKRDDSKTFAFIGVFVLLPPLIILGAAIAAGYATTNDVEHLSELLNSDPSLVKAKDYDSRTALHITACYGFAEAAKVLLDNGADVNATDRRGNSPLTDAESAGKSTLVRLLQAYGGQPLSGNVGGVAPPTPRSRDWEIEPREIDFNDSIVIGKGSFGEIRKVIWRGTPVAAKTILRSLCNDKLVVEDFRHEVQLLVKLRHPNIVQFLGAVTKSQPLMLITEFLPKGDLHKVLKDKGALHASVAVNFALDISRGMAYLHRGPSFIIHRDLKPRNVLMDEGSELKVGDFGLSKLISGQNPHDIYKLTGETGSYRYMAPEVFRHEEYDKSVDVFSFAMILYEMLEGQPPFCHLEPYSAASAVADGDRPIFRAKSYTNELKELIKICWQDSPTSRPSFPTIIEKLEKMQESMQGHHHHHWPFHRQASSK